MANNGRVKGQIGLGKARVSFTQNKNSGTNRGGQKGTTKLARSVNNSVPGSVAVRNSRSAAVKNPHTVSTVGLPGAKATKNNNTPRLHGRPSSQQENLMRTKRSKTTTNLRNDGPDTLNTVGLRGAKKGGPTSRTSSNLSRSAGDKNSLNPYANPPHANDTQGLTKVSKRAPKQSLQSHGTKGKTNGSRKTPFMGNRRQVTSALPPQKAYNAAIPAAVRRAAARAPSVGSNKPSFTTKTVKITSK